MYHIPRRIMIAPLAAICVMFLFWSGATRTQAETPTTIAPARSADVPEPTAYVYLPLVQRHWPPIPSRPQLSAIENPYSEGDYTLAWAPTEFASSYVLRESSNDPDFGDATIIYEGEANHWTVTGKAPGLYYYSVKAVNSWGESAWSVPQSTVVLARAGHWLGEKLAMEFYVSPDRRSVGNFTVYVSVAGCGDYAITHEAPVFITKNEFKSTGPFYFYGSFNSITAAGGFFTLSDYYIPDCGYVSSGYFIWRAAWHSVTQPGAMREALTPRALLRPSDTDKEDQHNDADQDTRK